MALWNFSGRIFLKSWWKMDGYFVPAFFPRGGYDQMRFFRWLWSLESEAQKQCWIFPEKLKKKDAQLSPTIMELENHPEWKEASFPWLWEEEWEPLELGILESIIVFLCCLNASQGWFCGLQLAPVFEELQRGQLKKHWQISLRSCRFADAKK